MEDLTQEFSKENSPINMEFRQNKTGEITAGAHLASMSEIVNGVQQNGASVLLSTIIFYV